LLLLRWQANKSKLSQSAISTRSGKHSLALSPGSDVPTFIKKGKTDKLFLEENSATVINDLSKEDLAYRLLAAVCFLADLSAFFYSTESLEENVQHLSTSLETKETRIFDL
jgi:hypothetical protein